ncbi:hypothetical protein O7602_26535 [Micromonospora sp. WMMD1128]|uniref:hypothetical protein n=1 Tax=Micromonospora sp. WMMD1128 TaxID=3015150 RepID=UPI00248C0F2B|nr:hypothetical protein [Micromonospora sp. WMMD1128]WBB73202.1 hypothetical protein O7602_26535 [Micromonospora sp. WMMD1128]
MRTRIGKLAVGVAMVTATVPVVVTAAAAPAFAGSNGQQIAFNYNGPSYGFVYLEGWNQDGNWVYSPSIQLDYYGYGQLDGWWWRGSVTVKFYNSNGTFARGSNCNVPTDQWGDWTYC